MATIRLPPDFKEFLKLLNAHGVEYLLVGGYAVIYHGYTRTTGDMDIWIAVNPSNAQKVSAALKEFGFRSGVEPEQFTQHGPMFRMGVPPFRIELLTTISGLDFADAYSRRLSVAIEGVQTPVLALDDLKTNKKASGRHKDLADLDELG